MIEWYDDKQVCVRLGYGDVGENCILYEDGKTCALCFEQLEKAQQIGATLDNDFDINNQSVVIEFSENPIESVDLMIERLQVIKNFMLESATK